MGNRGTLTGKLRAGPVNSEPAATVSCASVMLSPVPPNAVVTCPEKGGKVHAARKKTADRERLHSSEISTAVSIEKAAQTAPAGADRSIVGLHIEDGAVGELEPLHAKILDSDIWGSQAPASSRVGPDRAGGPGVPVDADRAEFAGVIALGLADGEPGVVSRGVRGPRTDQSWVDAADVGAVSPSNLGFPARRREATGAG